MKASADQKYEALYLMDPDSPEPFSAREIKERLGLVQDERTIQRWARKAYGRIPTRREMKRDPQRDAQVQALEAEGLHQNYCSVHQHLSFWPCLVRDTKDGRMFVCRKHARRGDW